MSRSRLILIGGAILVALVVAWMAWPKSNPNPTPTGRPVDVTVTPRASETPSPTPSETPSETPSQTPSDSQSPSTTAPEPTKADYPIKAIPEGAPLTDEARAMTTAAVDYLNTMFTLDYSKPYPGYDVESLAKQSNGELKVENLTNAKMWKNGPMTRGDAEDYKRMSTQSPGGVYKQTMTVRTAWVTESQRLVVVDIDTHNSLKANELVEETYNLKVDKCEDDESRYCVVTIDNTPADG